MDNNKKIVFRHTPKCAGTYIWNCLKPIGYYMSLGEISTYSTPCPVNICNHYNIQSKGQETGVVESNCDGNIPQIIRAHYSLDHITKHNIENIIVISNIRHPVYKFYSEFYHHRGTPEGKKWAKWLGDDIDKYISDRVELNNRPGNLKEWSQNYINVFTKLIEEVHIIILRENVDYGLNRLNDMGYNIKPIDHRINTCPGEYMKKYNYRLNDVENELKSAIDFFQEFKETYFNY